MKTIILFFVIGFLVNPAVYLQSVSGKVSVFGFSKDGTIKERTPVQLFKRFKESKYKIEFSFKGGGQEKEGIVLFDMKTTVRKNGKVIGTSSRPGWPWLPGDMYIPVEAFDFIPMLQKETTQRKDSRINRLTGNYEIVLEMKVSSGQEVSGSIDPVKFSFKF